MRERHNERKNEIYSNPDIVKERSHLNVHFKSYEGTYAQFYDELLKEGTISTRGLKPDAKVFAEMVFDVNTAYFDEHGGYDYAKDFFKEAYNMAVNEVGGEQYILSAVMHADEKNISLSEELDRDVYHYHMHVTYIPIVEKEIKWTKRCKDKALVGTVKEVIHQVSHSKKWASIKAVDEHGNPIRNENGKTILIPSYSLLQDRFYEHMTQTGFKDFERGVRGSTAQHLSVLDYKIQQDKQRLEQIEKSVAEQEKELAYITKDLIFHQKVRKTQNELESMGKKKMFGKVELPEQDYKDVIALAKEAISSRGIIRSLEQQLQKITSQYWNLDDKFNKLFMSTKNFRDAMQLAPQRIKEVISDIFTKDRKEQEARRNLRVNKKHDGYKR